MEWVWGIIHIGVGFCNTHSLVKELAERPDAPYTQVAYIWIAPNKLHEQSYFKMKNFFTENCALRPVIYDELDHSADGFIKPGEIRRIVKNLCLSIDVA